MPSMEHNTSHGSLWGLEAKVGWLAHADRAGQKADARGRGTRREKSSHRHTTAKSSRISGRLFSAYLKRYQPVTDVKSCFSLCGAIAFTHRPPRCARHGLRAVSKGGLHSPCLLPALEHARRPVRRRRKSVANRNIGRALHTESPSALRAPPAGRAIAYEFFRTPPLSYGGGARRAEGDPVEALRPIPLRPYRATSPI